MDHAIQTTTPQTTVLSRREVAALEFTETQRQMIRDTFAKGASDEEFQVLMEIARVRCLNPLLRQVFFVARWDSKLRRETWATQVSIDGMRAIAERTGLYAGQDEPEFIEGPDGAVKFCRVRVWRKDWPRPAVGVAYFEEYVQTARDKETGKTGPTKFWRQMPHVMLAKCAESLALRKAFPEDTSGLYVPEEMQSGEVEEVAAAAPRSRPQLAPTPPPSQLPAANDVDPLAAYRARLASVASADELVAVVLALAPSVSAHLEAAREVTRARASALGIADFGARISAATAITKDPAAWTVVALVLAGLSLATTTREVADVVRAQGSAVGRLPEALQVQLNAARTARLAALTDLAAALEAELHAAHDIPALEAIGDRIVDAFQAQRITPEQMKALADLQDSLCSGMEREVA